MPEKGKKRQFVRYLFFKIDPAWRREDFLFLRVALRIRLQGRVGERPSRIAVTPAVKQAEGHIITSVRFSAVEQIAFERADLWAIGVNVHDLSTP